MHGESSRKFSIVINGNTCNSKIYAQNLRDNYVLHFRTLLVYIGVTLIISACHLFHVCGINVAKILNNYCLVGDYFKICMAVVMRTE